MSMKSDVKHFIDTNFKPVDDISQASNQVKVRAIIGRQFPAIGEQCESFLGSIGLEADRCKRIRYYTYVFPGKPHAEALKYDEADEGEH